MVQKITAWVSVLTVGLTAITAVADEPASRPNIVLIMADDLSEETDLSATLPDVAADLREALRKDLLTASARFPVRLPSQQRARKRGE